MRRDTLLLHVEVDHHFHAASASIASRPSPLAERALAAVIATARAGAPIAALIEAARAALPAGLADGALAYTIGSRLGTTIADARAIGSEGDAAIEIGNIFSLHIVADGLAAATVVIAADGTRCLE